MALSIKEPMPLVKWYAALNTPAGEKHRFLTILLGLVLGNRLNLPSTLTANDAMLTVVAEEQWGLLHRGYLRNFLSDVNELIPHDMFESLRMAKAFWLIRYRIAAPRLVLFTDGMANATKSDSLLSSFYGIDAFLSPVEVEFINKYNTDLIVGYNLLNDHISEEV